MHRRHPGRAAEHEAWKASAYLYLLPALLFRREVPQPDAGPPADGDEEDEDKHPDPSPATPAAGAMRRVVAQRLQLAETDQWQTLLDQLRADQTKRAAACVQRAQARQRTDESRQRAAVERVLRDDLRGALSLLRGQSMAPPTPATADEVERLMCMPVTPDEREQTIAEAEACCKLPAVSVATRDVKRRARALQARRRAGPGPSGWRNSYVCALAATQGGPQQLRMWTDVWTHGTLPAAVAGMWTSQVAAPQDCGPRKEDLARRKLRPIALEECLVKFAESVACDKAMKEVLQSLEPAQQGAGSPDGTVVLVSLLRRWGEHAAQQTATVDPGALQVIFSSDLANAYGQVHRSALPRSLRLKAPQLATFLAHSGGMAPTRCSSAYGMRKDA